MIVYRKNKEYLVDSLLPKYQAQALHIAPYPREAENGNKSEKLKVLEDQIYNSWWNGYVLGYPEFFIDSYCENFHTTLSKQQINEQVKVAKNAVYKYFSNNSYARYEISLGNGDIDLLTDEVIEYIESFI
jgi:hypothetical protein